MKKILFFCLLLPALVKAQSTDTIPVDGFLQKSAVTHFKPVPLPEIKLADVVFLKRIWRDLDIKDPANRYFNDPDSKFLDVIFKGIDNGTITAYSATPTDADPTGDSFKVKITPKQAHAKFIDSVVSNKIDPKTGETVGTVIEGFTIQSDSITKFRIKEDYFFDKVRSSYEVRIVGIAPIIKKKLSAITTVEQPAFWIYFPQARYVFVNEQAPNVSNNIMSYDDVFILRKFKAIIVKESNPGDLRIKDYAKTRVEAEKESARIENELKRFQTSVYNRQ